MNVSSVTMIAGTRCQYNDAMSFSPENRRAFVQLNRLRKEERKLREQVETPPNDKTRYEVGVELQEVQRKIRDLLNGQLKFKVIEGGKK